MGFLPISINLNKRPVIIIGGGKVALRRAETFLQFGAEVKLYAKSVMPEIKQLSLQWYEGKYISSQLERFSLVVAATDDKELNSRIASDAGEVGALVNVASDRELSDFHFPALLTEDEFSIAVSSGGKDLHGIISLRNRIAKLLND